MYMLGQVDDPNFRAVFIRQTSTQLRQSGGLWDEAQKMYKMFGAKFRHDVMTITFPSGAVIQFKTCASDKDISNFDGGQYTVVVFDECQWHSQEQFMYLLSRIRSAAKKPHRLIATCNPLKSSFLLKFTEAYLDDRGIPDPSKFAKKRYFAQSNGELIFGDSVDEILERNNRCKPMSYRFIAATIYDNPVLIKRNPEYLMRLENLKRTEMERLLLGSWYAQEEATGYFKRQWVTMIDHPPVVVTGRVRAWDLAATLQTEANKDPDYTASVKMSRDKVGNYYIEDVTRFRKLTGQVMQEIINTAKFDGVDDCRCVVPKDAGAAGTSFNQHLVRTLAEHGIPAKSTVVSGHRGKVQRFLPFAAVAEAGCVYVVKADWNDWFFDELEQFDGMRKYGVHDD